MFLARSRSLFFLAFMASLLVMGGVLYLEFGVGLQPCPLCLVQRFFLVAFGAVCLAAFIHAPGRAGQHVYWGLAVTCALLGALAASRQVWLQSGTQAPQASCQPPLGQMLRSMPFNEVAETLLLGTPDCVRIKWTLLQMSLAEWSLLAFAGMAVFALIQLLYRYRQAF
ncbi:disulfide bond formation protein B [Pseudomonas sp. LS1212]|uniref:disulfide bond formation protein B n=1 Tax=Pseudomonas sp. LS1212 TaxID=2972478 RepID=UPI00215BAC2F|nr:disulfide bond formation protein B [Pseudomonas sp. LS1212]UVJ44194.1 disulfide bond formation protein B [Pseudomonas sp. LS1212]